jgi:hypothetical protein
MSHFAKVESGLVTQVIVAEQDFIDSGAVGDPAQWIQTSYNTKAGVHYQPNSHTPSEDQSKALRKNYAGIGYTYDAPRDAFIPPKPDPYPSWIVDDFTGQWKPPIPEPTDGQEYDWDESTVSWTVRPPDPNEEENP